MSNEIFVIDVDGYIGNSTNKEIEYAKKTGKIIRYYSMGMDTKKSKYYSAM
ncbi:hypothetical protein [Sutcliffiella horikoshii]|uniref:hypothetical protein n=1 Tax=Sutcliffiella horikoshii TaxID=79883 RepID=UPI00292A47CE|nr:hypothetical protein [Sutcliffiella horikoshii]